MSLEEREEIKAMLKEQEKQVSQNERRSINLFNQLMTGE